MIAVPGTAPVTLTDSRNCANGSRKLRQLSLPDPVLPASRPAVSPYPRRYSFHDHDDDLSLSRGRDELELRFPVNVNKCRMRFRSGFPIRAGGPGWFSYRPGYSSAGQGRLMRMESTAIFFAAGFPASRLRLSTGRSLLLLAAGSLTKITLRFDLGIFVVDAPRRLDAGRCNDPLPVTRDPHPARPSRSTAFVTGTATAELIKATTSL